MSPVFNEQLTLIDVELDGLLAQLRAEIIKQKNRSPGMISAQRYIFGSGHSEWNVAVVYAKDKAVVSCKGLLHEALNEVIEKVPLVPDLAVILGV